MGTPHLSIGIKNRSLFAYQKSFLLTDVFLTTRPYIVQSILLWLFIPIDAFSFLGKICQWSLCIQLKKTDRNPIYKHSFKLKSKVKNALVSICFWKCCTASSPVRNGCQTDIFLKICLTLLWRKLKILLIPMPFAS